MSLLLQVCETNAEVSNKTKPKPQDHVETEVLYRQKSIISLSEKVIVGDVIRTDDNEEFCVDDEDDLQYKPVTRKSLFYQAMLGSKHDSNIFKLSCSCIECFKCRETVILLFIEDFEYNILWERLQLLIKKFYDLVPDYYPYSSETESLMHKRYAELMVKSMTKWLSDGRIDTKKNIQISLGSNLPLSNEMTFILVFSMLYTRDPHQLFELLCIQVRSIVIAYSEGLKDIIKYDEKGTAEYNPSDLLNFIFDGYEKINNTAKTLSPLLFELQRGHLQQFSLTWSLLNKRMYQKYIYLEVQKIIPECILKLKQLVYTERYKAVVYRFIQFDDEMSSTAQSWRDVWSLLHDYHKGAEDIARRKRISCGLSILRAVRDSEFTHKKSFNIQVDKPVFEWMSLDDREEVWHYVHVNLKNKWIACTNPRVTAPLENITCHKCKNSLATHNECSCRTCSIAGDLCYTNHVDNSKQLYCTKCTFFEKLDRDYMDYLKKIVNKKHANQEEKLNELKSKLISESSIDIAALSKVSSGTKNNIKQKDIYHVSWALFKHLPDRVPYTLTVIDPEYLCIFQNNPCLNNACRVATNIIVLLYPLNFSKFLLHSYHPLNEEERKKLVTIHNFDFKNFIQKFCDDINKTTESNLSSDKLHPLHFMDLLWDSDDSDSAVLSDMASAFAECYLIDFPPPQKHVLFTYILKLLRPNGKDIEIDMEWLEYVGNPKSLHCNSLILETSVKEVGKKGDEGKIYEVQKKLEELNIKNDVFKKNIEKIEEISTVVNVEITALTDNDSDNESTTSLSSTSTSSSPSKEEMIENQIRKPLVEALKLAASNKKLEAELKSLQKEHSMLKDMVKDLEQIQDQNVHGKDHSDSITCKEHSFKSCHRQEGHAPCVCYYCTLFGQNGTECNSRIKETRDRLRKRLHQIQSNKDSTKSKNFRTAKISAELAKKIQTKQTTRKEIVKEHIKLVPKPTTSPATVRKPVVPPQPKPVQSPVSPPPALTTAPTTSKPITSSELINPSKVAQAEAMFIKKPPVVQKNETIIHTEQSTFYNKSIDDIIDYIEGANTAGTAKKTAKKQKQKQKKLDKKKISYLEHLKLALDSLNDRKKDVMKQLRSLRNVKKKDLMKISEIDKKLDTMNSTAVQLKDEILELVNGIKLSNPNFNFPELIVDGKPHCVTSSGTPTSSNSNSSSSNNTTNTNNNRSNQQIRIDKNAYNNKKPEPNNSQFLNQRIQLQKQYLPVFQKSVQTASITMQAKVPGNSGESSKRIVTIRRINTPYSEPQVTVTAKGLSPDKDQLLYTFINGQLVAAPRDCLKQTFVSSTKKTVPNTSNTKQAGNTPVTITSKMPNAAIPKAAVTKPSSIISTAKVTAITPPPLSRRERKMKKKQLQQENLKNNDNRKSQNNNSLPAAPNDNGSSALKENNKSDTTSANSKVKNKKEMSSNKENIVINTNQKNAKRQQTPQPCEKVEETSVTIPSVVTKTAKTKNKKGKMVEPLPSVPVIPVKEIKEAKKTTNVVKEKVVQKAIVEEVSVKPNKKVENKTEAKKVKAEKKKSGVGYIDPEFDNNLFKLLNLEDSDTDEMDEDTSKIDENVPPIVKSESMKNINSNAQNNKVATTAKPTGQPVVILNNSKTNTKQNSKQKIKVEIEKTTVKSQQLSQSAPSIKALNKFEKVESKSKANKKKSIDNPLTKQEKKILLNADTTIEPILRNKDCAKQEQQQSQTYAQASQENQQVPSAYANIWNTEQQNYGVSIMDQLNRGIKVEGLSLPPGITLTRVDAEAAEKIRAQKESIKKICQPMQTVLEPVKPQVIIANTPQMDNVYMTNPMMQMGVTQDPGGVIMVDTMKLNHMQNKSTVPETIANPVIPANVNKKNKRKNKNKKVDNVPTIQKINNLKEKNKNNGKHQNHNKNQNNANINNSHNQKPSPANIVTLRNPMFHGLPDGIQNMPPANPLMNQTNRINLGYDQPAAIIRNENGMFTIRNPALHQALASNTMNQQFNQMSNNSNNTNPNAMKSENLGYLADNNIEANRKCNSAIGSELKNAQQNAAKQNAWHPDSNNKNQTQNTDIFSHLSHLNNQQTRCYSPFESSNNYGFNSDFLNAQTMHQTSGSSIPTNDNYYGNISNSNNNGDGCYNVMNGFRAFGAGGAVPNNGNAGNGDSNHLKSLFGNIGSNSNHKRNDEMNSNHTQTAPANNNKFDDVLFLQNLQPGQRLNSEVTIHNISESKFLRNQEQNLSNDIEITSIPANNVSSVHVRPQQRVNNINVNMDKMSTKRNETVGEYGESIFAPNQTVNLSELESEERDIESFKRFNYYFEPPKNKPKINLNVKDIVVNKKNKITSDSPSSSLFGEMSSSISSNTQSCDDLLCQDMSGLNIHSNANSDPMIYDTDIENSSTSRTNHGAIGSKIKYSVDK